LADVAHTFLFLTAVSLCGLVFGGVVAGQLNAADTFVLGHQLDQLLAAASNHHLAPVGDLWWQRVVRDGRLLALLWLFGVSVMGLPFVVIAIFLRAFSVGFAVGFTVLSFGWRGVLVASVAIFAHQLLTMTSLLLAGAVAIQFSGDLLQRTRPVDGLTGRFLRYNAIFAVCAVGVFAGAAVQAGLAPHVIGVLNGP
jgi:stage II sporulation protein M